MWSVKVVFSWAISGSVPLKARIVAMAVKPGAECAISGSTGLLIRINL